MAVLASTPEIIIHVFVKKDTKDKIVNMMLMIAQRNLVLMVVAA